MARGSADLDIILTIQAEAAKHGPNISPLPKQFMHFRSDFGHLLYGEKGCNIPREDRDAAEKARLRNYEFFGAPCCAVISMDAELVDSPVNAMSVGMFVQIFMLALAERGLGSYPEVLRKGFGLGEDQLVMCGMAIGWPEENNAVNELEVPRDDLKKQVTFLEE